MLDPQQCLSFYLVGCIGMINRGCEAYKWGLFVKCSYEHDTNREVSMILQSCSHVTGPILQSTRAARSSLYAKTFHYPGCLCSGTTSITWPLPLQVLLPLGYSHYRPPKESSRIQDAGL